MDDLLVDLQNVFRRVFDEDELVITPSTSADDVDGWDSMAHINLIVAIEKKFGVRFTASDLAALGGVGQNVGNLLGLLAGKVRKDGTGQT
jgi:acyl carrier protein